MKRLAVGCGVAVLTGSVACTSALAPATNASGCSTKIELHFTDKKDAYVLDPPRLVCAWEEALTNTLVNNDDTNSHEFEIIGVGCAGDKGKTYNPVAGLLGYNKTMVPAKTSMSANGTPQMLKKDEIKALNCGGTNGYLYSYTIRVSGLKNDKDPDLEVSPPPSLPGGEKK
jgi:hypothetical protein